MSAKGKRLSSTVLETNGKALVEFLRLIPGTRHLIVEEGTQASWLYEILSPHVHEMVVLSVPKSKGRKNDKLDAFGLAEKLRTGSIERRVYKERHRGILHLGLDEQGKESCHDRFGSSDESTLKAYFARGAFRLGIGRFLVKTPRKYGSIFVGPRPMTWSPHA